MALRSVLLSSLLTIPAKLPACDPFIYENSCSNYYDGQCEWRFCSDGASWIVYCDTPPDDGGGGEGGGGGDSGGGGNPDPGDPDTCPPSGDGVNSFSVHDGNVRRRIDELSAGAGGGLNWVRFANSRARREASRFPLGTGGGWRHGWQYELVEVSDERSHGGIAWEMIYPSGHRVRLFAAADGALRSEPGRIEHGVRRAGLMQVNAEGGSAISFNIVGAEGGRRYDPLSYSGPNGQRVDFAHDDDGRLTELTTPQGAWLRFAHRDYAIHDFVLRAVHRVESAPAAGEWLELELPAASRVLVQHVRLRVPIGARVAEVQFFAEGSTVPLTGAPQADHNLEGTDGDPATFFTARVNATDSGYTLADGGAARLARVRVLTAPGSEKALIGASLLVAPVARRTIAAITAVTASNGETLTYAYEFTRQSGGEDLALVRATYDDGTEARYRYSADAVLLSRALLLEGDDPRYAGKAKHIAYDYYPPGEGVAPGTIRTERNPRSGAAWARLELDPADPLKRVVRYSDERAITYRLHPDASGRKLERMDSLGRKLRYEYAADVNDRGAPVAMIDSRGERQEMQRDAQGRATKDTRHGRSYSATYDERGRVASATDRRGRESRIERDSAGRVTRHQAADGQVLMLTYDAAGRVVSRRGRGRDATFTYDAQGRTATVTNALGATTSYGYDERGRVNRRVDALGGVARYERNARGLVTRVTHPDGRTTDYRYDTYGRKVGETDALGRTANFTYDELSRLVEWTDFAGRITIYDFTETPLGCGACTLSERPTTITGPDGVVTKLLYDSEGQLLASTVAAGTPAQATTLHAYDDDSNLIAVTDPLGRVTRYTYDDEGHRLSATDPLGRTTRWAYDADGLLVSETAPDGGETRHAYDARDRRIRTTDAAGAVTRYGYDDNDNLTQIEDATGRITRHEYTGKLRTATILPGGARQTWTHDLLGRVVQTTSPDGVVSDLRYDLGGRLVETAQRLPDGGTRVTGATYDALGRRLTATDPLGRTTRWTYDARGNVLTVTRPDGVVGERRTYDPRDLLLTSTHAAGVTTTYTYDAARNLTSLTDGRGQTYRFTYDAHRRKTAMIYPDQSQETWTYDLAGQLVAAVNRSGQTKTSTYSAAGELLTAAWQDVSAGPATTTAPAEARPTLAPTSTYTYDPAGRVTRIDHGPVSLRYTYDATGRLAAESVDVGPVVPAVAVQTVGYTYDAAGRRTGLTYPDGQTVGYTYDNRERLTAIDDGTPRRPVAVYDYTPEGRVAKLTRDNGVTTSYAYDVAGQLSEISHARGGSVLASAGYTLDELGRRTAQVREDGLTERYGYDLTGQLTSVDYGTQSVRGGLTGDRPHAETFAYDPVGNRTRTTRTTTGGASTSTYEANPLNQYTQIETADNAATAGARDDGALAPGRVRPRHDANGNLVDDGRQRYTYDAQNRLIAVESVDLSRTDAVRAEFSYDVRNRCVARKYYRPAANGTWTLDLSESRTLVYDTAWNLLSERTLDGKPAAHYIHGLRIDEIVVANVSGATVYPLADGLGSTIALTRANGKVVEHYSYDVYGHPLFLTDAYETHLTAPSGYRHLFTGREWLNAVAFNDHRYRYYSPEIGRWTSTDPIGFDGGLNFYAYVANSPANYSDFRGLDNPGCDLPGWAQPTGPDRDCYLRCCSKHDSCFYNESCTAASWGLNVVWVGGHAFGPVGKICSFLAGLHPCTDCNNDVM